MVGDDNGYKPPVPTKPLMPGVLLLPPGPNGEKWGIDDYAAQRDWGIDDFNAFTHPLGKVFNLETGEFVAAKNGLT